MLRNWKIFTKNVADRSLKTDEQQDDQVESSEVRTLSENDTEMQSHANDIEIEEGEEKIVNIEKDKNVKSDILDDQIEENKKEENIAEECAATTCACHGEESPNLKDDIISALSCRKKRNNSFDMGLFRNMVIKNSHDQRSALRIVKHSKSYETGTGAEAEEIQERNGKFVSDDDDDDNNEVKDIDANKNEKIDLAGEVIHLKFEIAQCRGDLDQQCLLARKVTEERIALANLIESVTKERNELIKENEKMRDEIAELQIKCFDGIQLQLQLEEVQHKLEASDTKNNKLEECNNEQLQTILKLNEDIEAVTTEKNKLLEWNKNVEQELDNHVAQDTLIDELKGSLDKAIIENDVNLRRKIILEEEQMDSTGEILKLREETKTNSTTISEVQMKLAIVDSERTSLTSDYIQLKTEQSRLIYDLQKCQEENLQLIARLELLHTPSNPYRRRNSDECADSFSFIPNLNSYVCGKGSECYNKIEEGLSVLL